MSYHQTFLLYCHCIWLMWIFILLGTIHELLEYRNFSIHSVHKCSSWPHMCMFHEVFQLPYLPHHLLLPYSCLSSYTVVVTMNGVVLVTKWVTKGDKRDTVSHTYFIRGTISMLEDHHQSHDSFLYFNIFTIG